MNNFFKKIGVVASFILLVAGVVALGVLSGYLYLKNRDLKRDKEDLNEQIQELNVEIQEQEEEIQDLESEIDDLESESTSSNNTDSNSKDSDELTASEVTERVSKLIDLDEDESIQVASISDVDVLKSQNPEFYKNAKNGDYLVILEDQKKVLIYRASTNKIVNEAPYDESFRD